MTAATAAAEYNANIGPDFSLADAYDVEYMDTDAEVEDETAERQRLNAAFGEWLGMY